MIRNGTERVGLTSKKKGILPLKTVADLNGELLRSDISKEISVEVNYTDEVEEGVRGYTFGNSIFVYARNTRTVRLTTETIIHEVTHIELDSHSHTQWEEAYCFAQEAKHKKPQLTYADLRYIIKTVKELYPEYPWR